PVSGAACRSRPPNRRGNTIIDRATTRYDHDLLAALDHPCFVARGEKNGPRLSLIGGIHGCEYSSIAAVIRFMTELDTAGLAGTITAVPVVSLESFRSRSPFVVPQDGQHLDRCCPGPVEGSYQQQIAPSIGA